jgi:hypothetical protein
MRRQERPRILEDRFSEYNHEHSDCEDVTLHVRYS